MTVFLSNSFEVLFLSFISGTGLTLTLLKLFKSRALRYDYVFDLILTIGLPILFGSGYHAMTIAIMSGIFVSVELFLLKQIWKMSQSLPAFSREYFKDVYRYFKQGLKT